jgi:hypothetical protein
MKTRSDSLTDGVAQRRSSPPAKDAGHVEQHGTVLAPGQVRALTDSAAILEAWAVRLRAAAAGQPDPLTASGWYGADGVLWMAENDLKKVAHRLGMLAVEAAAKGRI